MGIVSKIRKRRNKARKDIKAAQARARAEVKQSAKVLNRRQTLLASQEKALLKAEQKGLKEKRKHEMKLAKAEYERLQAGSINPDRVKRWIRATRIAIPFLLPFIYRGITAAQDANNKVRADRAGISTEKLAQFSGHGADLKARIEGIRQNLKTTDLPAGFVHDVEDRLDSFVQAADNAEYMTPDQRRRALNAINSDIDKVTAEIQHRLR